MSPIDKTAASVSDSEELDSFADELDAFDLLGPETDQLIPETDLSSTARAFNTRIKERKKAQELAQDEAEKAAHHRHTAMLKALVSIRKSLREVTRIDLGERFEFCLQADDWQGWPRLSIRLTDKELREEEYPHLSVTAHDRQAKGMIELVYDPNAEAMQISLLREQDLMRLPKLLRTCVRTYLDIVGDIVLAAENPIEDNSGEECLATKENNAFEENAGQPAKELLTGDLFEQDYGRDTIFEALPTVAEVGSLASLDFDLDD